MHCIYSQLYHFGALEKVSMKKSGLRIYGSSLCVTPPPPNVTMRSYVVTLDLMIM